MFQAAGKLGLRSRRQRIRKVGQEHREAKRWGVDIRLENTSCTVLLMLSLNQNIASSGGGWLLLSQLFGEQAIEI
jgi:hypothetical protein